MNKTTRKGFKVSPPLIAEGWYEETIKGLKGEAKKKRGIDLVKRQKDDGALKDLLSIIEEEVKQVQEDINRLCNMWFIGEEPPWSTPQMNKEMKQLLETFERSLRDFLTSMKPYLKRKKLKKHNS